MVVMTREEASSCTNPKLDLYTPVSGVLLDMFIVEYQVFSLVTGVPVQVFPVAVGTRAPVLLADCPGGDRLAVGHYVARWTVPVAEASGTHQVKWFFRYLSTSTEQTATEDFDVLVANTTAEDIYTLVADMRDEGVTTTMATDTLLLKRVIYASRMIDLYTKRFFSARSMAITADGTGTSSLLLNTPIVAISSATIEGAAPLDLASVSVYNRHLTQRLTDPDDRDNPRIEFRMDDLSLQHRQMELFGSMRSTWWRGQQNVSVAGVFGYTDYSASSPVGVTPEPIKHACKLMVMRELSRIGDAEARLEAQQRYRLLSETTRDQSYSLGPGRGAGGVVFTGDPDIDDLLARYQAPPFVGTV